MCYIKAAVLCQFLSAHKIIVGHNDTITWLTFDVYLSLLFLYTIYTDSSIFGNIVSLVEGRNPRLR